MKKQISCIILTFALLVSMLSVGFVLPAAADVTATPILASDNVVIAPEDNILKGATCSESAFTQALLYDGVVKNATVNLKEAGMAGIDGDYLWVTYTLAAPTDVESVLIAGSTATRDGGLGMEGFAVYVGDKDAAAIKADASVQPQYEVTGRVYNGVKMDFTTPIRATYVVFKIGVHRDATWNGNVWISELSATGTAPYSVTAITPSANQDKIIPSADNILAGAACSVSNLTDPRITDGKIENNTINIKDTTKTHLWVTYTLAAPTDVEAVLIAGSTATRDGGLGMQGFAVYVGDKDAAAIQADATAEPLYETTERVYNGVRLDLTTPVRATYVVFKIGLHEGTWAGNTWISEIAATGTVPYSVNTITGANAASPIAVEDNLLATAVGATGRWTNAEGLGATLYNGILNDQGLWGHDGKYIDGYDANTNKAWVTFDLGVPTDVDSLLIGGSGKTHNGKPLGFNGVDVYIGDKDAAAIKADSTIEPTYSYGAFVRDTLSVSLRTPVRGSKIVFCIGAHEEEHGYTTRMFLSELAAAGTAPYKVTTITEANVASPIAAEDNLLATATVTEPYMAGTTGAKLFNGIINEAGNTWDVVSKYFNKVVDGYMWVTFTLAKEASINELVISGACESGGSGPLGFDGVDVYIGELDHNAILMDDSVVPVYSHHAFVRETLHVELAEAVVGTKVVFKMGVMGTLRTGGYTDRIRLSELAVGEAIVKENYNVVCIGDSITWGCTAHSAGAQVETPYPAHLQTMLNKIDPTVRYTVTNLGLSGASVVDGMLIGKDNIRSWLNAKWLNNKATQDTVAAADYVFIMLGTNDAPNWDNGRRDLYKQEYKKLIDTIYGANADAKIYIVTSPAALKEPYYSALATDIVPMQLELAAELGLPVADAYNATRDYIRDEGEAAFIVSTEIDGLRIHPDSEGLGVIAAACADALAGKAHVSELKASATADADVNSNFEGVTGGVAAGAAHDANRVTPVRHNLLAADGVKIDVADSVLADGLLASVNTTAANATAANLTVDFGTTATISQILLGGCTSAVQVYVTDDVNALGEAVVALDATDAAGRIVTLNAPVAGRYLVVKAAADAQMSELAALGYRHMLASLGGQVRQSGDALRFGFNLFADGVRYADGENSYRRNIDDATITVNGVDYTLVDFGALVTKDTVTDELTLDMVNDVTCKKVPAQNLYEVDGGCITYTAVVVGIPEAYFDTALYARPYVIYNDGTKNITLYGECLSRTINGCAQDAMG